MTLWILFAFGMTTLGGLWAFLGATRISVISTPNPVSGSASGYGSPLWALIFACIFLFIGDAPPALYFFLTSIALVTLAFTTLCLTRRRPVWLTRFLSSLTPLNRRLAREFDGLIWTKMAWHSTQYWVEQQFAAYIPGDELSLYQEFVWGQKPLRDSSIEELTNQASSPDSHLRRRAGKHENSPVSLLEHLAQDPEPRVRAGVAMNLKCPAGLLAALASDLDEEVRAWAARNTNTPEENLRALTRDASARVQKFSLRNPNAPTECVDAMSESPSEHVRALACIHPNISTTALETLFDRWKMKDFEYPVSKWARRELKKRRRSNQKPCRRSSDKCV